METSGAFVENFFFVFFGVNSLHRTRAFSFTRFLDHTQLCTTFGSTPLDEWSAGRRDLYLTIRNTNNRQTIMPPGGIWTNILSWRAAAELRLRLRGHCDRRRDCVAQEITCWTARAKSKFTECWQTQIELARYSVGQMRHTPWNW
jgi:hypothetical protein